MTKKIFLTKTLFIEKMFQKPVKMETIKIWTKFQGFWVIFQDFSKKRI